MTQIRGTTRERGLKHYAALMPELCKHLEEINGHVRFKPPTQKETTRIVDCERHNLNYKRA